MLELGRDGELTENGRKRTKLVENSCQRIVNLINSLLDVEKFASGTINLDLGLSEVATIFERSVHSLAAIIEQNELMLDVEGSELELICDEERLTQVIINLLSNAIKYSPNVATIKLAAKTTSDGIEFSVTDNGAGIPHEHRELVFGRFYQIPGQSKAGSSGLGLAICKEIVKAHHGTIGVESNRGAGSRFWFIIPTKKETPVEPV